MEYFLFVFRLHLILMPNVCVECTRTHPYPDPDSNIPLLSVPPNVPFLDGLTAVNVEEGPPLWAGQARQQRIVDARAHSPPEGADGAHGAHGGGVGEEQEKAETLPAPPKPGRAPMAVPKPSSPQRFQVTCGPKPSSASPRTRKYSRWLVVAPTITVA